MIDAKTHLIINKMQYVFSINKGRAGSKYFSSILSTAKEVFVGHEPG